MSIPGILAKIVDTKRQEVATLQRHKKDLMQKLRDSARHVPADFKNALTSKKLAVIAEVKKASPSVGVICPDFHPLKIAQAYSKGGAACISVLTDQQYFQGHVDYLKEIRQHVTTPLLRKDFIIDELQINEALAIGADTFLLIVAILDLAQLTDFIQLGRQIGMNPLVEIHDEYELETALNAGADIIGVNNRDLRNFTIDMGLTARISPSIPKNCILVGESGIKTVADAAQLRKAGCSAILVGETLMRQGIDHCGDMIQEFSNC